jgi:hypothetical protein
MRPFRLCRCDVCRVHSCGQAVAQGSSEQEGRRRNGYAHVLILTSCIPGNMSGGKKGEERKGRKGVIPTVSLNHQHDAPCSLVEFTTCCPDEGGSANICVPLIVGTIPLARLDQNRSHALLSMRRWLRKRD